jgi:hypothetical protein
MTLDLNNAAGAEDPAKHEPLTSIKSGRSLAGIEVMATWFTSQVEHVLNNPIWGRLAKKKMAEILHSFEKRLESLELDIDHVGPIAQQAYLKIKRLLEQ